MALQAARGKNVEAFCPTIGRRLLEKGLLDEIDVHIAPILLGRGIRLYGNAGDEPIQLRRIDGSDATAAVNARYRPVPSC